MKILIAPDKFKGISTAQEISELLKESAPKNTSPGPTAPLPPGRWRRGNLDLDHLCPQGKNDIHDG
jgi:hypothetical protein